MKEYVERFQKSALATTVLVILLFLLVNWVSYGLFIRFDLSEAGLLRITAATKKITRNLPDTVTIEGFFSTDVPDTHIQKVKNLRDFLEEYGTTSDGKVEVFFLDPDDDADAKARASAQGIQAVQAGGIDEKGIGIRNIFLSVLISFGDKKEVISNVLETAAMEYELTSRIYKMAYPNERKIGFLANHGPFSLREDSQVPFASMGLISQQLSKIYGDVVEVDTAAAAVPGSVSTLIIAGPSSLSDLDKFRIDQFILRGGNVVLAIGGMVPSFQNWMASPIADDILDFFKQYGAAFGKDMLMEPENHIKFKQPVNQFRAIEHPYPVWLYAVEDNLQHDNPAAKNLPFLFFPWAGSVKPDSTHLKDKAGKETAKITILAKTTADAWAQSNFAMIHPLRMRETMAAGAKQNKGQFNLALHIQGKFTSYFKGKKAPKGAPRKFLKQSEKESEIYALATPYMLMDFPPGYLRFDTDARNGSIVSAQFVLTAIDTMNGFEELAAARRDQVPDDKVDTLEKWQKDSLTISNFLLPILGLGIFGALRFIRRKKQSEGEYTA